MVLPFADLVLLASNSATAIIASSVIAICVLGEKFIWKYDLTALFLIILGNTLTIVQSNKVKDDRKINELLAQVENGPAAGFLCFQICLYISTALLMSW